MLDKKFNTAKYGTQELAFILSGEDRDGSIIVKKLAASEFIKMIEIDKKGDIVTLTVGSIEADFSKQLVQSLLEELKRYQIEYTNKRITDARLFIEERIIDTEKDLKKSEELLKDFRDRNRRIENSPSLQLEQQRLNREVVVLTGVFTTLKQQLETTKIEEVKESSSFIIIDQPEAPVFYSKPNKKKIVFIFGLLGLGMGTFISYLVEVLKSLDKGRRNKIKQILLILSDGLNLKKWIKVKKFNVNLVHYIFTFLSVKITQDLK